MQFVGPYARVEHTGSQTSDQVKSQKALRPPKALQQRAEDEQAEHVAEQVRPSAMQKHVREQLDRMEKLGCKVVQRKLPVIEQITLQYEYDHVNDQEVPDHGGYIEHLIFSIYHAACYTVGYTCAKDYRCLGT
jgi:phosphoribosylanthranilate isomerase